MSPGAALDPFSPHQALGASGVLRRFNLAGVLSSADVHVAERLAELGQEEEEAVRLAVALAVRAPRLGHVHVDLEQIAATASVEGEDPAVAELPWPPAPGWADRVRHSPLVAVGEAADGHPDEGSTGQSRPLRLLGTRLYLDRLWRAERLVAQELRERIDGEPPRLDETVLREGLGRLLGSDPDQRHAAASVVRRRLTVIAGGPGTGKTTTIARALALVVEQSAALGQRAPVVALAAPTGKAAARLEQAVHEQAGHLDVDDATRGQLLSLQAGTLHRLLGRRPDSHTRFRHHRHQRLPHELVVVDETSMVSLWLMARLLEAVRPQARLVLVGDPAQLASIEAGAVLGDIVEPSPPGVVRLQRSYRFGDAVGRLAEAVRCGAEDEVVERLGRGTPEVRWLALDLAGRDSRPAPAVLRTPALAGALSLMQAAQDGNAPAALAELGRFRILCAHRHGPYGVSTWTAEMRRWLALERPETDLDQDWYAGRPLLVTRNNPELGLLNGDTGVVVREPGGHLTAAFERRGEVVSYSPSRLEAYETAYAMTIHKSQGSQFDAVAVLLPGPESRILTRELLLTAVTRPRRHLILVASEAAIRTALRRPAARSSGLAARLQVS